MHWSGIRFTTHSQRLRGAQITWLILVYVPSFTGVVCIRVMKMCKAALSGASILAHLRAILRVHQILQN